MPRSLSGLKQEAPEEEDAQDKYERDDDYLNQAHNRFLMCQGRLNTMKQQASRTGIILVAPPCVCQRTGAGATPGEQPSSSKNYNAGRNAHVPSKHDCAIRDERAVMPSFACLLEAQRQTPAHKAREADVRPAEDRFKVVEKEFVRQILDVELYVERCPFTLQEVSADG
jgi:hypothetical protein